MTNSDECPVCGSAAVLLGDADYGDKKAYDCYRCGLYNISRTALTVLERKYGSDKIVRARLSHAIRKYNTHEGREPIVITSNLLEKFVERALPGPEAQADNLISAIANSLGENTHGTMVFDNQKLASLVGVVNPEDITKLAIWLQKKELVSLHPNQGHGDYENRAITDVGLTIDGWKAAQTITSRPTLDDLSLVRSGSEGSQGVDTQSVATDGFTQSTPGRPFPKPGAFGIASESGEIEIPESFDEQVEVTDSEGALKGEQIDGTRELHDFVEIDGEGLLTLSAIDGEERVAPFKKLTPEMIADLTVKLDQLIIAIRQDNSSLQRILKDQLIVTLEATLQELKAPMVEVSRLRKIANTLSKIGEKVGSKILEKQLDVAADALAKAAKDYWPFS